MHVSQSLDSCSVGSASASGAQSHLLRCCSDKSIIFDTVLQHRLLMQLSI